MFVTMVLDYAGGTYLGQTEILNLDDLVPGVRRAFDWNQLSPRPTHADLTSFFESLEESKAERIVGLRHVWCIEGLLKDRLLLVHVINTILDGA